MGEYDRQGDYHITNYKNFNLPLGKYYFLLLTEINFMAGFSIDVKDGKNTVCVFSRFSEHDVSLRTVQP